MSINKHGTAPSGQPRTQTAGLASPPACAEMCAVSTLVLSDRRRRRGPRLLVCRRAEDYIPWSLVAYMALLRRHGRQTHSSFGEQAGLGTHRCQPDRAVVVRVMSEPTGRGEKRHPPPQPGLHSTVIVHPHAPGRHMSQSKPWQARDKRRGHDLICLGTFPLSAISHPIPHHNHITHIHPRHTNPRKGAGTKGTRAQTRTRTRPARRLPPPRSRPNRA